MQQLLPFLSLVCKQHKHFNESPFRSLWLRIWRKNDGFASATRVAPPILFGTPTTARTLHRGRHFETGPASTVLRKPTYGQIKNFFFIFKFLCLLNISVNFKSKFYLKLNFEKYIYYSIVRLHVGKIGHQAPHPLLPPGDTNWQLSTFGGFFNSNAKFGR